MSDVHWSPAVKRVHTVTQKRASQHVRLGNTAKRGDSASEEAGMGSDLIEKSVNIIRRPSRGNQGQARKIRKDAPPSTQIFEFVTVTSQPSAVTRHESSKKVRTQAMRDYLRKQNRQAMSGVVEVVESTNPEQPAQYKGKFKLASWTHKSKEKSATARREKLLSARILPTGGGDIGNQNQDVEAPTPAIELWRPRKQSSLVFTLNSSVLDPFNTLSIKLGPLSERLLVHYNIAYNMNSVAINAEGNFFSYVKTDAALFHSILYLVALHSDLQYGLTDSPACLYHGGKAFRLINERLGDPGGVLNDMTIAAVAMLVNKENLSGRYELSEMHMQGLEKMVRMRGGVHVLQGVFRRIVTWSDFCYATVWYCQPSFPRLIPRPAKHPTSPDPNANLLKPTHLFGACSPIVPIIHALRTLSHSLSSPNIVTLNRMEASDTIYNLEYDLLMLNKPLPTDPEPISCIFSFEAVPLKTAAHICLWLAIRELPPTSELLYRLVQRLQDSLMVQVPGWWSSNEERRMWLLWILFVGAIASLGRMERFWFVGELGKVCADLDIWTREALRDTLKLVLWQDEFCENNLRILWDDIVLVREMAGSTSIELAGGSGSRS